MKKKFSLSKSIFLGILGFFSSLTLPQFAYTGTKIDSNIISDTKWIKAGSPYVVAEGITVDPGVRLIIEPGVEVNLNSVFEIHGELIAEGTESKNIVFKSGGIVFETGAVPSKWDDQGNYLSGSIIKHCEIRHGSGVTTQVDLYISDNIIQSNSRGINNSGNSIIENNKILNNSIGYSGGVGSYFINGVGITNSGNSIIRNNKIDGNYGLCENYNQLDYCYGCGIYNQADFVEIEDNTITNNILEANDGDVIAYGAAIYNIGESVTIIGNIIRDNETRGPGGSLGGVCAGIYNLGKSLTIESNDISCNRGYGIWIENNNCTVKDNYLKNGIRIEGSDSTVIKNNEIIAISIFSQYSTNTLIESNTFLENAFIINDITGGGRNDRSWAIKGNLFSGNDSFTAISNSQHAVIKDNIIRGYTDGILNQGKATIESNEISNNSHYGISTTVMLDSFVGNNIFNNFESDFYYTADVDQTAIMNYWGTTNRSEIMDNIYDYWDHITLGKVIFEPFAATPFIINSLTEINEKPLIPRYRLYNPNSFHHHYTTDTNEYNALETLGWIQEGISCHLYDGIVTLDSVDTVPYYRLYNPNSHEHHWTTDANEYDLLGTIGWIQEGADGYVFASPVSGSEPLYRLYNPNDGLHHWTMDTNEMTILLGFGYIDEGIACYVFP